MSAISSSRQPYTCQASRWLPAPENAKEQIRRIQLVRLIPSLRNEPIQQHDACCQAVFNTSDAKPQLLSREGILSSAKLMLLCEMQSQLKILLRDSAQAIHCPAKEHSSMPLLLGPVSAAG
jgi:hypothetical protein